MVKAQSIHTEQPIKTLLGMNCQLELYRDHVRLMRTDPLAQIVPSMFNETKEIALDEITGLYLHESRYFYSRWISFIIQDINHKRTVMLFDRDLRPEAENFKRDIEAVIDTHHLSASAHS